jgi:hypothetical protein
MTEWQNGKFCIQIKVIVWFSKKKLDLIYIYIINTHRISFICYSVIHIYLYAYTVKPILRGHRGHIWDPEKVVL